MLSTFRRLPREKLTAALSRFSVIVSQTSILVDKNMRESRREFLMMDCLLKICSKKARDAVQSQMLIQSRNGLLYKYDQAVLLATNIESDEESISGADSFIAMPAHAVSRSPSREKREALREIRRPSPISRNNFREHQHRDRQRSASPASGSNAARNLDYSSAHQNNGSSQVVQMANPSSMHRSSRLDDKVNKYGQLRSPAFGKPRGATPAHQFDPPPAQNQQLFDKPFARAPRPSYPSQRGGHHQQQFRAPPPTPNQYYQDQRQGGRSAGFMGQNNGNQNSSNFYPHNGYRGANYGQNNFRGGKNQNWPNPRGSQYVQRHMPKILQILGLKDFNKISQELSLIIPFYCNVCKATHNEYEKCGFKNGKNYSKFSQMRAKQY